MIQGIKAIIASNCIFGYTVKIPVITEFIAYPEVKVTQDIEG